MRKSSVAGLDAVGTAHGVDAADSGQDAALLLTAALTGLRLGEIVPLRWRDVDLDRHVLRVRAS